tara:strand:+ start:166 stop:564 length:399 start_codon:yes stop_codon:yes gene_type:complete
MKIYEFFKISLLSKIFNLTLIKYFFVGLFNTAVSFGIFSLLYFLGLHYFIVSMVNMVIGVGISYYNHRRFTFSIKGDFLEKFTPIALAYYLATNILLYCGDIMGFNIYITYLFILLPVSVINYFVLKIYVFK